MLCIDMHGPFSALMDKLYRHEQALNSDTNHEMDREVQLKQQCSSDTVNALDAAFLYSVIALSATDIIGIFILMSVHLMQLARTQQHAFWSSLSTAYICLHCVLTTANYQAIAEHACSALTTKQQKVHTPQSD